MESEVNQEGGITITTVIYIKQIIHRTFSIAQGTVLNCSLEWPLWEKHLKKRRVDICITDQLCCTAETHTEV